MDQCPKKITLTFDTNCKFEEFPKLLLNLIIYYKDSQNSLRAVHSQLWFITGKEYRLRSAKGREAWGGV